MSRMSVVVMVVLGLLLAFVPLAQAGQSDAVTVKVKITPSISVKVAEEAISLGSVVAGSTTLSSGAVTITNNGSGVYETYSLSLSNPSGWTASGTAAGLETYVLNAAFSNAVSGISWGEANHALSATPVACSASKFAGDYTGVSVPYNTARKLWFQFKAPTATAVTAEQNIVMTITAQLS